MNYDPRPEDDEFEGSEEYLEEAGRDHGIYYRDEEE